MLGLAESSSPLCLSVACLRPLLCPLRLSEQVGIINEVAFSWILTGLSAGLPRSLMGVIGLKDPTEGNTPKENRGMFSHLAVLFPFPQADMKKKRSPNGFDYIYYICKLLL